MSNYLHKRHGEPNPPDSSAVILPCGMIEQFPALGEFISLCRWEDGNARQPGTLLLCYDDGRWRLWLNDRDAGVSAWVSGPTWSAVMVEAEQGLRMDGLEWRRQKPPGSKRGR